MQPEHLGMDLDGFWFRSFWKIEPHNVGEDRFNQSIWILFVPWNTDFCSQFWRQTCIRNNNVMKIYPRKQNPCFEIGEHDFRMRLRPKLQMNQSLSPIFPFAYILRARCVSAKPRVWARNGKDILFKHTYIYICVHIYIYMYSDGCPHLASHRAIGQMTHPRLFEMPKNRLQPDVVSYNSAISACDKSEQWQAALHMLGP